MHRLKIASLVAMHVLLAGCALTGPTDPGQAVLLAAAEPTAGFTGTFPLTVRSVGRTREVHLNSEADYRDPRNLSITVTPSTAAELERKLGAPLEQTLLGKHIVVTGTAMRTRIDFLVDGQPSGKYYFQTHVLVSHASQLRVL